MKNRWLTLSDFFNSQLDSKPIINDRLRLCLLLSFLNLKGKDPDPLEDTDIQTVIRKHNSEAQELLITTAYDNTHIFQFRKDGYKFVIEQNKMYYITEDPEQRPFVFKIFQDGSESKAHRCFLEEIEDYLLRNFYQIRI